VRRPILFRLPAGIDRHGTSGSVASPMKGVNASSKKRVAFSLSAPTARSVLLAGSFTQWELGAIELKRLKSGVWKTTVSLEPGRHSYRYIVDGAWHDDPGCPVRVKNPFGSEDCLVEV